MSYDFDEGSNSSDSAIGPFLNWHARETLDGALGSRTFSIRNEEGERIDVTAQMKKGVAFDLDTLRTGWCFSDGSPGVAPEWQWNDSPSRFNTAQPEDRGGERWKKGFSVRVALGKDEAAQWSQSGAGAWSGLVNLMRAVKEDGGSGETVIAAMTDVDEIKFKKGSTSAPMFSVKKWADRPECLTASSEPEQVAAAVEADDEF
tara:strand:+ start:286 stop:894 length:609 start_codon:yes stop_codon:yes gene_type:complete